ncbi:hypothetical protein A9Q84_17510 [Halobacteriovorax marinus]|uniref:tRNA-uridine aminocarboxypropyltransferase n=1 Tax=Halobacteriovorax marinus TaxID=97084 RepID=A0A1Y5F8X7_9BACT|nr:hypothetical protein A9Q84_17510 [Halobacteriovorax marinus]
MHRAELELTTNTAYFADKLLKNSVIRVRGFKDEPLDLVNHVDTENYTPLYLFPDEEAKTLDPSFLDTLEKPPLLIVPDGSWRQAKKMKKRESFLGGLQSVVLPTGEESSYRLRTAPAPGAVCTFEAIARALGVCEGSELQKSLESVFKLITDRMYYSRAGLSDLADLPKFLETKKASNEASNEKE